LILAFKQCKVFSELPHISFRNALQFVSKIPSFDFKTTCYSFLKHHIFILETPQIYFRNIADLFWKYVGMVSERLITTSQTFAFYLS
jgi:hypothetical protein